MSATTLAAVDAARIDALAAELAEILGEAGVTREEQVLERSSLDGSYLSPLISEQLPLGRAQLVAFPASAQQIAETVAAAVRHGVPITPRGKGTGNYGQGIPMAGGLVLDTTKARAVVEVGDGFIVAEAGAPMIQIEQAANRAGQQLLMYPSTVQSTLGGFLSGGSGGTGSIAHGVLMHGFVRAIDVVFASPEPELVHFEGVEAEKYLHNYGVVAIIARAEVVLEPLQEWRAFYASFDDYHTAFQLVREFRDLEPTPRLVSGDVPLLADALPADEALPAGKASLRGILDVRSIEEATRLVEAAGGTVEAVREGINHTMKVSMTSYNHAIEWLQKSYPNTWFHVEVNGDALVDRIDEVHEVYPGESWLHIEAQATKPIGMLAAKYTTAEDLLAGFDRLAALGVGYHNPHQWFVDYFPDRAREMAATTDPQGLLNPGKLVKPDVDTGTKPSVALTDDTTDDEAGAW
ncbi:MULTISPECIES: FAD-binding oxidoreductase [Microbacterium]|uniref:FAD-binding oxidoreductase n=1 Tax=Microbacterium TaxID=33882 RepID=UPI0010F45A01|nr:FAD-binding oxidoreductase [Microbacterium sp. 4NA327F11]MCK9916923.1 FAD-binding oxidoreductase [Microbacteriaceae bacterium K1510]